MCPTIWLEEGRGRGASRKAQAYLKRGGYEVVDSWSDNAKVLPWDSGLEGGCRGHRQVKLRSCPGENNSMGKMKFNFANARASTCTTRRSKEYFAKSQPDTSNGCIRLEDAKRLGRWLMGRDAVAPSPAPSSMSRCQRACRFT